MKALQDKLKTKELLMEQLSLIDTEIEELEKKQEVEDLKKVLVEKIPQGFLLNIKTDPLSNDRHVLHLTDNEAEVLVKDLLLTHPDLTFTAVPFYKEIHNGINEVFKELERIF